MKEPTRWRGHLVLVLSFTPKGKLTLVDLGGRPAQSCISQHETTTPYASSISTLDQSEWTSVQALTAHVSAISAAANVKRKSNAAMRISPSPLHRL
jgi:hypothetical protein